MAFSMVECDQLTKRYGPFLGVHDLTVRIPSGQVVALVGPNGAGKTTLLRMLAGFFAPSAGTARIGGFDVVRARARAAAHIGYLPENGPLYLDMTPGELLHFAGRARGMTSARYAERLEAVIEQCDLATLLAKPIGGLSKGMRQRVGMAVALLHDPLVLILDEPTSGLDPSQVRELRLHLLKLTHQKTVILSTHILQEVDAVAGRVLLMNHGRLIFDGTPSDMASGGSLEDRFVELTAGARRP